MKERPRFYQLQKDIEEHVIPHDQALTWETVDLYGFANDVCIYDNEGNLVAICSRDNADRVAGNLNLD
jgi:hypothetical protein